MADLIEININTLDSDITAMRTELNGLKDEMKQAFGSVRELDSMWDGPANEAFNKAFQADHETVEELCRIVDCLIGYMERARDEYKKCESAVSAEIDRIRI